jgi:hypothetical protein
MESSSISSMVGRPETRRDLYKTIQASNNGGSISPDGTTEELKELERRGLKLNTKTNAQKFLSPRKRNAEYCYSAERNLRRQGDTNSDNNNRRSVRAVGKKFKNLQSKGTSTDKKIPKFGSNNENTQNYDVQNNSKKLNFYNT